MREGQGAAAGRCSDSPRDLVAHAPHNGLAGGDSHQARQQALPHGPDALLLCYGSQRVEEALRPGGVAWCGHDARH